MAYDPNSTADRTSLAGSLHSMLSAAGFARLEGHGEDVYQYKCIGGTEILVYSSIVSGMVRGDGEDAIRVCAVYRRKDGGVKGLFKDTRVNRTGEEAKIVDRTKDRMRNAYTAVRDHWKAGKLCHRCNAPLFLAKSGNMVCAETCWVKQ